MQNVQDASGANGRRRFKRGREVGRTGARFGPPGQWRLAAEDGDAADPLLDAPDPDSEIGQVGARFGGSGRKRKRGIPTQQTEERAADGDRDDEPDRFAAADDFDELFPDGLPVHDESPAPDGRWLPDDPSGWSDADWMSRPESHTLVRPYAWTRGRTHTRSDLAVETLVSTIAPDLATSWEHRAVTELCATPRSVAEVSALMSLPLGVARVLISDLADSRAVTVHHRAGGEAPDLAFMGRVLAGLRRL